MQLDLSSKNKMFLRILMTGWFFMGAYTPYYWSLGAYLSCFMVALCSCVFYPIVYLLNKKGRVEQSFVFFTLSSNFVIFMDIAGLGGDFSTKLYFIPAMLCAFLFFGRENKWQLRTFTFLPFVLIILSELIVFDFLPGIFTLSLKQSAMLGAMNLSGTFIISYLFVDYFKSTIEQQVETLKKSQEEKSELEMSVLEKEKMASLGELAAGVGHEINNPLTVLYASILKLSARFRTSENERIFTQSFKALDQIKGITANLRIYARNDYNEVEVFDFRKVVNEVVDMFVDSYHEEGVELILDDDKSGEIMVKACKGKMIQSLMNFLQNGKDATEGKSVRKIKLVLKANADRVALEISDNGSGMEKSVTKKVFDPFYTTKEVGRGTGMGLALCQKTIEQAGGKIELYTKLGEGTTFTLSMPLHREMRQKSRDPESRVGVIASFFSAGKAVLVADDEEGIRDYLEFIFDEMKIECKIFARGDLAFDELKSHPEKYSLVISDIKMPGMGGLELAQKVEKELRRPPAFIFISGGTSDRISCDCSLAKGFVAKPFNEEQLLEVIEQVMLGQEHLA